MLTWLAGVSIMALGTLSEDPNCGLTIVPCGMNYFHAHKFRSRCVVEFGPPVEVKPEYITQYDDKDERPKAVNALLEEIHVALRAVTVNAPDYETLMASGKCAHGWIDD
jgi:glycerol-3-phosphate O-acyltransferase / dihydroxyacetone phosphate acyltransferase